ncbi:hypothetical protein Acr_06g0001300 [Actinidia rufa]|uniref:DUF4283 domain-containing protein n=1 Tax=Actinidia rufa TaxID=165716 RepID=A0A7J0EPG7_9ERIC|nr:hypothetical protein Acr_06g0001300 [Actinidia rufa]
MTGEEVDQGLATDLDSPPSLAEDLNEALGQTVEGGGIEEASEAASQAQGNEDTYSLPDDRQKALEKNGIGQGASSVSGMERKTEEVTQKDQRKPFVNLFPKNRMPSTDSKLNFVKLEEGPKIIIQDEDIQGLNIPWEKKPSWHHGSGWIIFQFSTMKDLTQILENGPYIIYGRPLLLKTLPRYFGFENEAISTFPVWVQLRHVPLDIWCSRVFEKICSKLGKLVQMDQLTTKRERVTYARCLVEIDLAKDLTHSASLQLPGGVEKAVKDIRPVPKPAGTNSEKGKELEATGPKEGGKQSLNPRKGTSKGTEWVIKKTKASRSQPSSHESRDKAGGTVVGKTLEAKTANKFRVESRKVLALYLLWYWPVMTSLVLAYYDFFASSIPPPSTIYPRVSFKSSTKLGGESKSLARHSSTSSSVKFGGVTKMVFKSWRTSSSSSVVGLPTSSSSSACRLSNFFAFLKVGPALPPFALWELLTGLANAVTRIGSIEDWFPFFFLVFNPLDLTIGAAPSIITSRTLLLTTRHNNLQPEPQELNCAPPAQQFSTRNTTQPLMQLRSKPSLNPQAAASKSQFQILGSRVKQPPDKAVISTPTPLTAMGEEGKKRKGKKNQEKDGKSVDFADFCATMGVTPQTQSSNDHAFWNIRALNKPLKQNGILKYMRKNKVSIMGVLETTLSQHYLDGIARKKFKAWKVDNNFQLNPNGRTLVFWREDRVILEVIEKTEQVMHCLVTCKISSKKNHLSFIYAFNTVVGRRPLWDNIRRFDFPGKFSNHSPCTVSLFDEEDRGATPFKFFNMWAKHDKFLEIVGNTWRMHLRGTAMYKFCRKLKAVKVPLKDLNKQYFSHIAARAEAVEEDLIRAQQSKNHIASISMEEGSRTTSSKQVSEAFVQFYKVLLGSKGECTNLNRGTVLKGKLLEAEQASLLLREVSDEENKSALFSIVADSRLTIIDKITDYISAWAGANLSYAGRAELVKSVLQGVECFWLTILSIPAGAEESKASMAKDGLAKFHNSQALIYSMAGAEGEATDQRQTPRSY